MKFFNKFPFILQFVCFAVFSTVPIFAAAGNVDTTFQGYLGKLGVGKVNQVVVQTDDKVLITGNFTMVNGVPKTGIVRLNADGTLDMTFNPAVGGRIALQSNGKIIAIGASVKRLNSDGSLDVSFNSNSSINNIYSVYDLKISSDNKIIFSWINSSGIYYLTRLNADGSLDAEMTLSDFIHRIAIAPDGKIVYVNGAFSPVKRLNQNLTPDNTFTQVNINHTVYGLEVQPDGKVLIQGIITQINGTNSPRLVRVNADGTVDVSFVTNATTGVNGTYSLTLLPNGKILSGGTLRNSDGTLVNSATTSLIVWDADMQSDGKVIIGGELPYESTAIESLVTRFNINGSFDTTFKAGVGAFGSGNRVIVQPDDKILVAGDFNYSGGIVRRSPTRLNADGTIDTTFNFTIDSDFDNFANYGLFDIFPNGKILIADGSSIYRLNSDGSQDIVLSGVVSDLKDIKALPNGGILLSSSTNLKKYNADGTLDATFNVFANASIYKVALQPDGKILLGGNFTQVNGIDRSKIARLNSDGSIDTTFNSPSGGINNAVLKIIALANGKLLISGAFSGISFNTRNGLARLNSDGSLDLDFVPPQSFQLDDLNVQADGKVLTVGSSVGCRRLNANGTLDTTFVCNTNNARVRGVDVQSNGKIIIAGDFGRVNGVLAPGIARLSSVSTTMFDYDGDGRADVSVFRPSENKWYILQSSNGLVVQPIFAINGDLPVPADFDGDGKTDISIFRPTLGDWWSLSSLNNNQVFNHWCANGDIPRPSDFDGDGRADYVVFRAAENNWYRISSATGTSSTRLFGAAGDKPVSGDFDGDGKSDVVIYRPSTGDWWWQSSVDNIQRATRWGISTDIPAPADFDGDGKTDFAVYRPSTGVWYVINSSSGSFTIMAFGLAEDKPIPADYDGDGKADIAVFRPSTGIWYLMRGTSGFTALQFGISTDIPTPNAFVP